MKNKQKGVSLLEITVSLAISLIIISGMTQAVVNMNKSARVQLAESNIQETLLLASNRLSYSLKQSFSSPCGDITSMIENRNIRFPLSIGSGTPLTSLAVNNGNFITGSVKTTTSDSSDYATVDNLPILATGTLQRGQALLSINSYVPGNSFPIPANVISNSDFILTMEMGPKTGTVSNKSSVNSILLNGQPIPTTNTANATNQAFMITDCTNTDIFIGTANNNLITPSQPVQFFEDYSLGEGTAISTVSFYLYYVGFNSNLLLSSQRVGLRRMNVLTGRDRPIIDGITNLNVSWGLSDTAGGQTTKEYFSSQNIMDSNISGSFTRQQFENQVVSARITLTAGSIDERMADRAAAVVNPAGAVLAVQNTPTLPTFTRTSTTVISLRNKIQRN